MEQKTNRICIWHWECTFPKTLLVLFKFGDSREFACLMPRSVQQWVEGHFRTMENILWLINLLRVFWRGCNLQKDSLKMRVFNFMRIMANAFSIQGLSHNTIWSTFRPFSTVGCPGAWALSKKTHYYSFLFKKLIAV